LRNKESFKFAVMDSSKSVAVGLRATRLGL
jgi:hypothetical protein